MGNVLFARSITMSKFTVRWAKREDCPAIMKLVTLANFENIPGGPLIGPEILQRDGFDVEHPFFRAFVAQLNPPEIVENGTPSNEHPPAEGEIVGYALFYYNYSSWHGPSMYLEDIFVMEKVRSIGVGSALFDRIVQEAHEKDSCRLDFIVLNYNPATEFYKRKGCIDITISEKWHHYRMEKDAIARLMTQKKKT